MNSPQGMVSSRTIFVLFEDGLETAWCSCEPQQKE